MAFNIADFQSYIGDTGVLQTNKYDVMINFNNGTLGSLGVVNTQGEITGSMNGSTNDSVYRCVAASLPGLTMRTTDMNRYGIGIYEKIPFSANYTDVSLTFLMDRYGDQYNFWYSWFNYVFGVSGAVNYQNIFGTVSGNNSRPFYTAEYKDNYTATITITVYDLEGNDNLVVTLLDAYPITLNDIALNWTDNNNLMKLTTTITFREWILGYDGGSSTKLIPAASV
jgi:hypothetical protein